MRLFIEPTETMLFRTGRPFDAGESNFADSLFPPTPETIQGAIRAAIAAHWESGKSLAEAFNDPKLVEMIGDTTKYGNFRIAGFSLGRYAKGSKTSSAERLFPAPSHILQDESGSTQIRLEPRPQENIATNLPKDMWLLHANTDNASSKLEPLRGWLTEQGLYIALRTQDQVDTDHIIKDSDIYTQESRLGIGMNNKTKTTQEGLLYQVQMIRMNHVLDSDYRYGFVVDIALDSIEDTTVQSRLNLPDHGWITLGGERRAAYFEVIKPVEPSRMALEQFKEGNMLYLATPAAFKGGWQPASWSTEHQPITASISRYQPIGGWQLKPGRYNDGENKVMRRCVPAGSVYFFNETVTNLQHLTDYDNWQIGYGITYTGEWK